MKSLIKKSIKKRQTRQYESGILRSCFWQIINYYYYYYYYNYHHHHHHHHYHWHCTKTAIILRDPPLRHPVLCNLFVRGRARWKDSISSAPKEPSLPALQSGRVKLKGLNLTNWREWGQHSDNENIQEIFEKLEMFDPRVDML